MESPIGHWMDFGIYENRRSPEGFRQENDKL